MLTKCWLHCQIRTYNETAHSLQVALWLTDYLTWAFFRKVRWGVSRDVTWHISWQQRCCTSLKGWQHQGIYCVYLTLNCTLKLHFTYELQSVRVSERFEKHIDNKAKLTLSLTTTCYKILLSVWYRNHVISFVQQWHRRSCQATSNDFLKLSLLC